MSVTYTYETRTWSSRCLQMSWQLPVSAWPSAGTVLTAKLNTICTFFCSFFFYFYLFVFCLFVCLIFCLCVFFFNCFEYGLPDQDSVFKMADEISGDVTRLRNFISFFKAGRTESSLIRHWLVACSAPSHYLNQCWNIVKYALTEIFHWYSI